MDMIALTYVFFVISLSLTLIYFYGAFYTKPEHFFLIYLHNRSYLGFTFFLLLTVFVGWIIIDQKTATEPLWELVSKYPDLYRGVKAPGKGENISYYYKTKDGKQKIFSFYKTPENHKGVEFVAESDTSLIFKNNSIKLRIMSAVKGSISYTIDKI